MAERRLQAVVFDLDGLLFNTEELYQFVGGELLRRRGKAWDTELLTQIMGCPQRVVLQLMIDYHGLDATVDILAQETADIFTSILHERLETMPGAIELLDTLDAARIPKAIATSSGRKFTDLVLGAFQLQPRFAFILTSEDVEHGKPDPEVYQMAAARFGIPAADMMVLEDSQKGCQAAVAAGAFTVAVPAGHSRTHDFTGVTFEADTLRDPRIYEALGLSRIADL